MRLFIHFVLTFPDTSVVHTGHFKLIYQTLGGTVILEQLKLPKTFFKGTQIFI
jgi:hypothetical protein